MDLDPALKTYVAECGDLLQEMEDALLRLEREDDKSECLNAIFRAAHTIKGSAGVFGLDEIVAFTHGVENLLDKLRGGEMSIDSDLTALLLACRDHIRDLIDAVECGADLGDADLRSTGDKLTARVADYGVGTHPTQQSNTAQTQAAPSQDGAGGPAVESDNWHISLRFGPDSLRDGMDPLSFLRYLGTIGTIVQVVTLADGIPPVAEMDAESCYLGFEISYRSDADKQTIENVFEFIRQDSIIRILPPRSRVTDYISLIQALPEEDLRVGEMLVRCGSLTQTELDEALRIQEAGTQDAAQRPIGEIVVDAGMTEPSVLQAAVEKQAEVRQAKTHEAQSIRVDADKLDQLINLIGELAIAGAGTSLNALATGNVPLIESVSTLSGLVEEVRDSVLRLRMVQIGSTFNRFQRVVRDVSNELGKEIELFITGADTELDKTVVEKIGDPLMHLVRNAIDHGIEPVAVRTERGKPSAGKLHLNAYHDSGSIVIEVSDDGAGLHRDRILEKARAKGLVGEADQLDDREIYNLIFEPGFSTASEVTNLSGRGVGMDVVKRNIAALRGTVELESTPGEGTTFRIRMPLTLAIIDGFQVDVDKTSFVIPLDMVLECVELMETGNDRDYINLRGEVLPFIRLRDLFAIGGQPSRRENVVVVNYAGKKAGLVVDKLTGELQTVIKPLGPLFSHVAGVSGSTILGDGRVALILDVPGLVEQASTIANRAAAAA